MQLIEPYNRQTPAGESLDEFTARLAREAFSRGDHIPKAWVIAFDDGADWCLPAGWYILGNDALGFEITFPVRHSYGPYKTEGHAREALRLIQMRLADAHMKGVFECSN